ncbi:MAG: type 4a pilus biogenesis protein PilO [Bdellovibrionales bacterium]|nr:type 4a pilus biogenesis protein PilO [Bdellovibrionales bacterium]
MNSLIEKWKELIGQLEVLKTYYNRLTERERYIVLASGAGSVLFVLFIIYIFVASSISGMAQKIESNRKNLFKLQELQSTFDETERQVQKIENTIRMTSSDFQLATELEKIARKYKIVIESISNRPGQPTEIYRESQANITVKGVDIRTLINFFNDIENSPNLMRITSLQVKPDFKDASLLNVTFVVSTFQLKGTS